MSAVELHSALCLRDRAVGALDRTVSPAALIMLS